MFTGAPILPRATLKLIILAGLFACTPLSAQQTLPDWSGAWQRLGSTVFDPATVQGEGQSGTPGVRQYPPYNEEWERKYEANLALRDAGLYPDPISICGTPTGFPRILNMPDLYEFALTEDEVWIIQENGPNLMRIYTDGRDHAPPDLRWPTYTGDSVGHWESDTLVFDTLALLSSEDGPTILDRTGAILSDAAHIFTRMHLIATDTLEIELTIHDEKALTEAWVVTRQYRRMPEGTRLYDYACAENNRNPVDLNTGRTLTLDAEGEILDRDLE